MFYNPEIINIGIIFYPSLENSEDDMSTIIDSGKAEISILSVFIIVTTGFIGLFVIEGLTELGVSVEAKTITVDVGGNGNYTTIQSAIDNASDGDTIHVWAGTYFENVIINKTISLIGNGTGNTTINGNGTGNVIEIVSDWVNVTGLYITNSSQDINDAGIKLLSASNCSIKNNVIANNQQYGIYCYNSNNTRFENNKIKNNSNDGISAVNSNFNKYIYNNITNNSRGIELSQCEDNSIENNHFFYNRNDAIYFINSDFGKIMNNSLSENPRGIYSYVSDYILFKNNTAWNNSDGMYIKTSHYNSIIDNTFRNNEIGIRIDSSMNNKFINNNFTNDGINFGPFSEYRMKTLTIDTTNTINNKPIYFLKNNTGGTVFSGAGQIIIVNATNVKIENQNISNSFNAIQIYYSSNINVSNNSVQNNYYGIRSTASNSIFMNNSASNNYRGFYLQGTNNLVLNNEVFNNFFGFQIYSNFVLINNSIYNNSGYGIYAEDSYNLVKNNKIINSSSGIYCTGTTGKNIISNNFLSDNKDSIRSGGYDNRILNNTIINYYNGIIPAHYNEVINNTLKNGNFGIRSRGSYNLYENNSFINNSGHGIYSTSDSDHNRIKNNYFSDNNGGITFGSDCDNNLIKNNTITNNSLYGIYIDSSYYNVISYNSINKSKSGIFLQLSYYSRIEYNSISNNRKDGIYFEYSRSNTIIYNEIENNTLYGINLTGHSYYNKIHHNNIINNNGSLIQAFDDTYWYNDWNDSSGEGNYWSDYTQRYPSASNNGKTWDTPYNITSIKSKDYHPLAVLADYIQPVMVDQSETSGTTGEELLFKCKVTDNAKVLNVWLFYWTNSINEAKNVSMVYNISSDLWEFRLILDNNSNIPLKYNISAEDTSNNWVSTGQKIITITDNDKPELGVDSTPASATTGDPLTFSINCIDNINIDEGWVYYRYGQSGQYQKEQLSGAGNSYYKTIIVLHTLTSIYYYFIFNDTSGNKINSSTAKIDITDNDLPEYGVDNTPVFAFTGDTLTFSIVCTDNIKINQSWVFFKYKQTGVYQKEQLVKSNQYYNKTITVNHTLDPIYYYFSFEDTSENLNESLENLILVYDNDKPGLETDLSDDTAYTNELFNFSVRLSDNIAVTSASAEYYYGVSGTPQKTALSKVGDLYKGSILVLNTLEKLHYRFLYKDANPNNDNETPYQAITVIDREEPQSGPGPGDLFTFTGDNFEIQVKFTDNIGIDSVKMYYTKSENWQERTITKTAGDFYTITNSELSIDTTNDASNWKYYLYGEDTSGNFVYYGTSTNPYVITVIDDVRPIADAGVDIYTYTNEVVTFDGSKSTDNIGITDYLWSFEYYNKPRELYGKLVNFTFETAGEYEVTLTVFDDELNKEIDTLKVTVYEIKLPYAELISPVNNSVLPGPDVYLKWFVQNKPAEPVTYTLYFGTTVDPPVYKTNLNQTEYMVPISDSNSYYYWKIQPWFGDVPGKATDIWVFQVSHSIPRFELELHAEDNSYDVYQGMSVTIPVSVANRNDHNSDQVRIELGQNDIIREFSISKNEFHLDPLQFMDLSIMITTKDSALPGIHLVQIKAISMGAEAYDLNVFDSINLTIDVKARQNNDTDNDKLPDSWEKKWFGGIEIYGPADDPDKDGHDNLEEYLKGTDPTKADTAPGTTPDGSKPNFDGSKPKEQKGARSSIILGSAVAVVIIIVVLLLIYMFFYRKQKGGKKGPGDRSDNLDNQALPVQQFDGNQNMAYHRQYYDHQRNFEQNTADDITNDFNIK